MSVEIVRPPEDTAEINARINTEIDSLNTKTARDLLRAVHESVYHLNPTDTVKLMRTQARFATLLVKLSEQADISSRRIIKLTLILVILTVVLIFFTTALIIVEFKK